MYCVEIGLAKVLQTRMFDEMKLGVLHNLKLIKSCVDDVPTGPIEIAMYLHTLWLQQKYVQIKSLTHLNF